MTLQYYIIKNIFLYYVIMNYYISSSDATTTSPHFFLVGASAFIIHSSNKVIALALLNSGRFSFIKQRQSMNTHQIFIPSIPLPIRSSSNYPTSLFLSSPSNYNNNDNNTPSLPSYQELIQQKSEAIQSFTDNHDGIWLARNGAYSFSITSDVAAGMTNISRSLPYRTTVSTRIGLSGGGGGGKNTSSLDALKLMETFSWNNGNDHSNKIENDFDTFLSSRTIPLGHTLDIDSVDGSYSLHMTTTSSDLTKKKGEDSSSFTYTLPKAISGIDPNSITMVIEHVVVKNENKRVKCFLLYGNDTTHSLYVQKGEGTEIKNDDDLLNTTTRNDDTLDQRLLRVVIVHEDRIVGDDKQNQQIKDTKQTIDDLEPFPISSMSLSLGPWLGDLIIRDKSYNVLLPQGPSTSSTPSSKGFGKQSSSLLNSKRKSFNEGFAEWILGVQKIAFQYDWDFGTNVKFSIQVGRCLGCSLAEEWPLSSRGELYEMGMSRRIDPNDRYSYLDYEMGVYAGFLVGSVYVKAPRFLTFNNSIRNRSTIHPILTEFAVFQKNKLNPNPTTTTGNNDIASWKDGSYSIDSNSEVYCSRITRLYDDDGFLKQGTTAFLTLEKPSVMEEP